jgi:hypothetical protein
MILISSKRDSFYWYKSIPDTVGIQRRQHRRGGVKVPQASPWLLQRGYRRNSSGALQMSHRTFPHHRETPTQRHHHLSERIGRVYPRESLCIFNGLSIVIRCRHYIQLSSKLKGARTKPGLPCLAVSKRDLELSQRLLFAKGARLILA